MKFVVFPETEPTIADHRSKGQQDHGGEQSESQTALEPGTDRTAYRQAVLTSAGLRNDARDGEMDARRCRGHGKAVYRHHQRKLTETLRPDADRQKTVEQYADAAHTEVGQRQQHRIIEESLNSCQGKQQSFPQFPFF